MGQNGAGKTTILNGVLLLTKLFDRQSRRRDAFAQSVTLTAALTDVAGNTSVDMRARMLTSIDDHNSDEVHTRQLELRLPTKRGTAKYSEVSTQYHLFEDDYFRHAARDYHVPRYALRRRSVAKALAEFDQLQALQGWGQRISYYQASKFTDPTRCPVFLEFEDGRLASRHYPRLAHTQLLADMYELSQTDRSAFNRFSSFVGAGGLGLVDRIEFSQAKAPATSFEVRVGGRLEHKTTKRSVVIPMFVIGRSRLSANQLSEGTFRALGVAFYVMHGRSSLILLEEPEVCVHHGLLRKLIELIRITSQTRQIILSTHSAMVLDAVDPESVYLVTNDKQDGTKVRAIPAALSAREYEGLKEFLRETGSLGEYWRHGGI